MALAPDGLTSVSSYAAGMGKAAKDAGPFESVCEN
jgi:hypothetical protein